MTDYKVLPGILRALQRGEIDSARYIMASYADETRQEIEALLRPAVETSPDARDARIAELLRQRDALQRVVDNYTGVSQSEKASTRPCGCTSAQADQCGRGDMIVVCGCECHIEKAPADQPPPVTLSKTDVEIAQTAATARAALNEKP